MQVITAAITMVCRYSSVLWPLSHTAFQQLLCNSCYAEARASTASLTSSVGGSKPSAAEGGITKSPADTWVRDRLVSQGRGEVLGTSVFFSRQNLLEVPNLHLTVVSSYCWWRQFLSRHLSEIGTSGFPGTGRQAVVEVAAFCIFSPECPTIVPNLIATEVICFSSPCMF